MKRKLKTLCSFTYISQGGGGGGGGGGGKGIVFVNTVVCMCHVCEDTCIIRRHLFNVCTDDFVFNTCIIYRKFLSRMLTGSLLHIYAYVHIHGFP